MNQVYNKSKAELQSKLPGKRESSPLIIRLGNNRTWRINHYLHVANRHIVDRLVIEGINTLVIGENDCWKQESNMRRKENQNFVQLPHARFIEATFSQGIAGVVVHPSPLGVN
jgi:putative transposase